MKTVVFDLCGTLLSSNTTLDFIRYIDNSFFRNYILDNIFFKYPVSLLGKFLSMDIYRYLFITRLKGHLKNELEEKAFNFIAEQFLHKSIPETMKMLHNEVVSGSNIIICSASLDCVVKAVVEHLEIKCSCIFSELQYTDDVCEGVLLRDVLGKKHNLIASQIDLVVTDNLTDLELVRKSNNSFIISKRKNVKFWKKNGFSVDLIVN